MTKLPLSPHPIYYLSLLCIFLLVILHADCQLQSQEVTILLKLKQQWQNPPLLDHWVSSTNLSSHCSWPEVYCTNGSVNGLDLSYKDINGTIPPFICDLRNLTFLSFLWNNIGGEFPTGLYNCSNLTYLDISQNLFVGPIPSDIDRMATLETLNIGANNFSFDIPPSIGNLHNLKVLSLIQSLYNGSYPPEIANLENLEILEMSYNQQLLPSELTTLNFTSLKKLRILSIAGSNLIGEIPATIGELESLEYLDLSMNNLTGRIPESVFAKKNLTKLYLFDNSLTGEIPEVTESWSLSIVDLSVNNLTGHVPDSFGKLQKLSSLVLMMNKLSGEIPASIGRLPALTDVRLFSNNFSGTLPPDFGRFSALEGFQVFSNNFTGELPKDLCAAGKLQGVVAENNALTGEVPESLARCDSLLIVKLSNNRFSGKFPEGIWKVTNLSLLLLSGNQFEGQIPSDVSWNMSSVDISNNRFSGEIPVGISSWKNLVEFQASNNLLTGRVPEEITDLALLTTLFLSGNQLSGTIPEEIISWRSLNTLDLSRNQLSGSIPDAIGSLPVLTQLDFSENRLSGSIPDQLGRLSLNLLNLSSNRLVGTIPSALDIAAYSDSFLNNSGLCTTNPSQVKLGACRAGTAAKVSSRPEIWIAIIAVGACLLVVLVVSLSMIRSYKRKRLELKTTWKMTPFHVLNFTESNILSGMTDGNLVGSGGSGKVYCVCVNQSGSLVAVKRICNNRRLDYKLEKEFQAEVQILGKIRHLNIVKLLCCISSESSKLLVYEYLENRSLDQWLYRKKRAAVFPNPGSGGNSVMLDWPKRLRIAIGAAQGLCYMHHDCSPPIIHRDVKSSNVLLDSEFNAKIADFGLARILMKPGEANSMSVVAGTFGYIAPEYAQTTRVNEKIDVYSFGIILLELTTGREANDDDEDLCLADWAWQHIQDDKQISDALDKEIKEPCYMKEMSSVFKLGIVCTATLPSDRPSMKEVLQILLSCSHHIALHVHKSPVKEEYDVAAAAPLLRNSKREQQNNH